VRLSVFVLTRGRTELLRACVASILADLPEQAELIVVVNGRDPQAEALLGSLGDSRLRWTVCAAEPRALCRNRGFRMARGEILYFLDDDVRVPRGLFQQVLARFGSDPELAVLGGPNRTPPESPALEKAFGAVMTSGFAAPLVRRRYEAAAADRPAGEHELILCNLAVRRSLIPQSLRFQRGLKSNEENLFLFQCQASALKIRSSGRCYVYHRRRKDLTGFVRQIFSYGYGRAQQTLRAPASAHPLFLVPAFSMALGPLAVALKPGLIALYVAGALLGALFSKEARACGVVRTALLTPLVHGAYGLGFWAGCWDGWKVPQEMGGAVIEAGEGTGVA